MGLTERMGVVYICAVQYGSQQLHVALEHRNVASVTEQLNFLLHLILIYLKVNSHIWLVVTILDNTDLDPKLFVLKNNSAEPD